jgi:dTDP-4-amino-4,6-dideoxygalactose transaminase
MTTRLAIHEGAPVRTQPFPRWPVFDDAERSALEDVLTSGEWGIGGMQVPRFEREFAGFHAARFGIAAANGTATLEMALRAVGVREGDEVILPPYTFYATLSAILVLKAVPVFVDIEGGTYCLDPAKISTAMTERTRAIIPVLFAGCPVDVDRIAAAGGSSRPRIVLDAAQAQASEWNGKRVGALGDLCSFSFQSSKNMTAGEGGILTTNDERLAALSRSFGNCGREQGRPWYEHHRLGSNFRMTEFQAAILLCQLRRVMAQTERRQNNAKRLSAALAQIPGIVPLALPAGATRHTYHLFVVKYQSEHFCDLPRGEFLRALQAEGIPAHAGYVPLYRAPLFTNGAIDIKDVFRRSPMPGAASFPVTERAANSEAVWISHTVLLGDDQCIEDVVDAFAKIWEHRRILAGKS